MCIYICICIMLVRLYIINILNKMSMIYNNYYISWSSCIVVYYADDIIFIAPFQGHYKGMFMALLYTCLSTCTGSLITCFSFCTSYQSATVCIIIIMYERMCTICTLLQNITCTYVQNVWVSASVEWQAGSTKRVLLIEVGLIKVA